MLLQFTFNPRTYLFRFGHKFRRMRWSEAVTLEFVKIYLKHECLWNPSHPGYKQKHRRDAAYSDICNEFKTSATKSLTILEVKNKIKNLRTTYIQQVQKILQKSNPDSIYEPSLVWFHEMDRCLKNVPTKASFNSSQEIPEIDSSQIWVDHELHNHQYEFNPDPLVPQIPQLGIAQASQMEEEYESSLPEEPILQVKRERLMNHTYKKSKKKKLKHTIIHHNPLSSETTIVEDEFDVYGKFIATQLRKMEIQKALRLQLHIHTLVNTARVSDIIG